MQDSVIMAYLASHGEDNDTRKLRRIREGTGYFEGKGISLPSEADYAQWRKYLEANKPGRKKGTLMSAKTSGDWKHDVENFYDWLREQQQSSLFGSLEAAEKEDTDMSEIVDVEPVGRENEAPNMQGEVQEVSASENKGAGQVQVEAVTTEKEDTDSPSPVATDKPRRGRKPKSQNANRMQISVYLPEHVYDVVKNYSWLTEQAISDVVASLVAKFAMSNKEIVDNEMKFFRERKARMLNIQQ